MGLRIALDIRPALARGTGVGSFIQQLVLALDALDGEHSLALFTSSLKDRWPADRLAGLRRSRIYDRRWPVSVLNLLWHRLGAPKIESLVGEVDIAHSPTPLLLPSRARKIVTLHDLYFMRRPEHTRAEIRRDYAELVRRHAAAADAIVAVSEATALDAQEMLDLAPERITVCREDAAPFYDEPPTARELELSSRLAREPFLLFVGTIEPRKNLAALLRAFAPLAARRPDVSLVLAGERGWGHEDFDSLLASLPCAERVRITGYQGPPALRALYSRAAALVMPSHCEGFGLPLVEAMACGCPLVVADNSSLPEVAGDAALLWRGGEEEELAHLMERVLTDETLRAELAARARQRRKQFSWEETARKMLALYHSLCPEAHR